VSGFSKCNVDFTEFVTEELVGFRCIGQLFYLYKHRNIVARYPVVTKHKVRKGVTICESDGARFRTLVGKSPPLFSSAVAVYFRLA
jgi:hypothetical protein